MQSEICFRYDELASCYVQSEICFIVVQCMQSESEICFIVAQRMQSEICFIVVQCNEDLELGCKKTSNKSKSQEKHTAYRGSWSNKKRIGNLALSHTLRCCAARNKKPCHQEHRFRACEALSRALGRLKFGRRDLGDLS